MQPDKCFGHKQRQERSFRIKKMLISPPKSVDETRRVLIKQGPVSVETSLKELEEIYANKSEWKVIEEGGLLSIPVEEFGMINLPKPDREGKVQFGGIKEKGAGNQIESYPITQTIQDLNEQIMVKYNKEKETAEAAGKSKANAEGVAQAIAKKLPEFTAVQEWLDNEAEIKLKKSLEHMMAKFKIPALILRSISLKAISALKDLGLQLSGNAEIDLVMTFVSGDFLHVVICEVKRADTYPWQTKNSLPNKQAVNKAENQLAKDVEVLLAILAGYPPKEIFFHTLACFPDASSSDLEITFCSSCLDTGIVSQEDLADLRLLQKKTQVPEKPDPATTSGKKKLLTFTARLLSHQSLLHIGNREVEDKEKLVTERHRHNFEMVDGKILQKEFIVASPQQQQVIANFTASSTKRHLVLEGPAGTGKTLVALQVANNLMKAASDACEEASNDFPAGWEDFTDEFGRIYKDSNEPVLVVTTPHCKEDTPIMKYLEASTRTWTNRIFKWRYDLQIEFGSYGSPDNEMLLHLSQGLAKKLGGRQIVMLVDEIIQKDLMSKLEGVPESVRLILIANPVASKGPSYPPLLKNLLASKESPLTLPPSFLRVTLTTPYRSTIAITSLARYIAKCSDIAVPGGDFGSVVEGTKPIFFDVDKDKRKVEKALEHCHKQMGDNIIIIYVESFNLVSEAFIDTLKEEQEAARKWHWYEIYNFHGWEADKIVVVTDGTCLMEQITRARTHLAIILVGGGNITREYFQQAADESMCNRAHQQTQKVQKIKSQHRPHCFVLLFCYI